MTSYYLEYSCIPLRYFRSVEEHLNVLSEYLGSTLFCIQPVWELLGSLGRIVVAVQKGWVIELWLPNHFTLCWCSRVSLYRSLHLAIPKNVTPRFLSSRTLERGSFIWYCVSSVVAREIPPLAISAIFKARCLSECSSCTLPPCSAIVADMLKTYNKLVAASRNQIRLLAPSYMLL